MNKFIILEFIDLYKPNYISFRLKPLIKVNEKFI